MKVLHVTNIAGVPSLLVQGLVERGIEADLIGRKRNPYRFPHETVVNVSAMVFPFYLLQLSQNYDIVHVHALSYRHFYNIDVFLLKTSRAKLVTHLHGTEIRESCNRVSTKVALLLCDQILVGTPDLLRYYPKATWLPTPIDPVFKTLRNPGRYGNALYFRKWYEPEKEEMVRLECEKMGLKLTVPTEPILYNEMPNFLNRFEVFFDRFTIPSLSKTALEALACGCKVVSWNGLITNPKAIMCHHSLKSVSTKLIKLYEKLLTEV